MAPLILTKKLSITNQISLLTGNKISYTQNVLNIGAVSSCTIWLLQKRNKTVSARQLRSNLRCLNPSWVISYLFTNSYRTTRYKSHDILCYDILNLCFGFHNIRYGQTKHTQTKIFWSQAKFTKNKAYLAEIH